MHIDFELWFRLLEFIKGSVEICDGEGSGSPSSAGEGRGHPDDSQSGGDRR